MGKHFFFPHLNIFLKIHLFLIGGELLDNIVLVSAMHQRASVIGTQCPLSLEPPSPSHSSGFHGVPG